jgi:membrane-associated phospholipid phosphatase
MNGFIQSGISILLWLQSLGAWLVLPMTFFTFLGQEQFYLLVMPALFWCFDAGLGLTLGVMLLTSASLNSILKLVFGLPRPTWVRGDVLALSSEPSFGLPSGHAQNAVVMWGRLAAESTRRWVVLGFGILILLISISRIYLGAHYPMDVLAGWVIGGLVLGIALRLERPIRRLSGSMSLPILAGVLFLISIAMIVFGNVAAAERGPVPAAWIRAAAQAGVGYTIDPLSTKNLVSSAAAFFGLSVGGILLFRSSGFNARGPFSARLLRYILGLAGVVVIYYGLRVAFPSGFVTLRYLRYSAVGFWVSFLAPKLFIRLRLASPSRGGRSQPQAGSAHASGAC